MNIMELKLGKLIDISQNTKLKEKIEKEQQNLEVIKEVKKDFINEVQKYGSNFKFPFLYKIPTTIQGSNDEIKNIVTKAIEEVIKLDELTEKSYKLNIHSYNSYYDYDSCMYVNRLIVDYSTI